MKNFSIKATNTTPNIIFDNNHLIISGRSYPEDAFNFYDNLIIKLDYLHSKKLTIEINLQYINTASSKMLLKLFKTVDQNSNILEAIVLWHYEEDDEDILEEGKIFSEYMMKTDFQYCLYV